MDSQSDYNKSGWGKTSSRIDENSRWEKPKWAYTLRLAGKITVTENSEPEKLINHDWKP